MASTRIRSGSTSRSVSSSPKTSACTQTQSPPYQRLMSGRGRDTRIRMVRSAYVDDGGEFVEGLLAGGAGVPVAALLAGCAVPGRDRLVLDEDSVRLVAVHCCPPVELWGAAAGPWPVGTSARPGPGWQPTAAP